MPLTAFCLSASLVSFLISLRNPYAVRISIPLFSNLYRIQNPDMGYGYLLGFAVVCQLTRHIRLSSGFLSVGLRFRYLFFSPAPHDANLESRYKVRW